MKYVVIMIVKGNKSYNVTEIGQAQYVLYHSAIKTI